jgi:hypothetical protein
MTTQQAQIIAYIDDYKLFMIATLAIPLLMPSSGRPIVAEGNTRRSWNDKLAPTARRIRQTT